MADGLQGTEDQRETVWLTQLQHAQQALEASEERNAALREELRLVAQQVTATMS